MCPTLCDPMTHQAPLSAGFSGQEYWSGLPFPSSGYLPDTGIELMSLTSSALAGGFFTIWATREAYIWYQNERQEENILQGVYIGHLSPYFWLWVDCFQLCWKAVGCHLPLLLSCHAGFYPALEWTRRALCLALESSLSLSLFFFWKKWENAFHLPLVMLWWQIIRNFNQSCFVSMTFISKWDCV